MPQREQDDLPYRSPVTNRTTKPQAVNKDTEEYSTLKEVHGLFLEGVDSLYKDFNAFDILSTDMPEEAKEKFIAEVKAKQLAYNILQPLLEQVDNAVKKVDKNFGG